MAGLLSGLSPAVAQRPVVDYVDSVRVEGLSRPPRWVLSLAPLALFDGDNTVQVGVERLLGGPYSVLADVGYGPAGMNLWRSWNSSVNGGIRETWRGRTEFRRYTRRNQPATRSRPFRRVTDKPLGNYLALDLFYKQVNADEAGSIGRSCDDGSCQYYQRYQARAVKYVAGTHVKVGRQSVLYLSPEANRLVIDYYVGLGVRRRLVRHYGRPEPEDAGFYFTNNGGAFDNFWSGDTPVVLSVAAGLRVGYVF